MISTDTLGLSNLCSLESRAVVITEQKPSLKKEKKKDKEKKGYFCRTQESHSRCIIKTIPQTIHIPSLGGIYAGKPFKFNVL